jgi:hypothetical protein
MQNIKIKYPWQFETRLSPFNTRFQVYHSCQMSQSALQRTHFVRSCGPSLNIHKAQHFHNSTSTVKLSRNKYCVKVTAFSSSPILFALFLSLSLSGWLHYATLAFLHFILFPTKRNRFIGQLCVSPAQYLFWTTGTYFLKWYSRHRMSTFKSLTEKNGSYSKFVLKGIE